MGGSRLKKVASQLALVVAGGLVAVTLTGAGPVAAFNVPNNSVNSAKIVNGSIQAVDMRPGAVGSGQLAPALRPLWAKVGRVGDSVDLLRGRGAVSVAYLYIPPDAAGWVVTFDRPLNGCGWTATVNANEGAFFDHPYFATVSEHTLTDTRNDLFVQMWDDVGPQTLSDGYGLTVSVQC